MSAHALTSDEADRLDGTLPGVMPDWAEPLTTPARAIGICGALIGLILLAAARLEPANELLQVAAYATATVGDLVGLLDEPATSAFVDPADRADRSVELHMGRDYLITAPLLALAGVCLLFGYTVGRVDRARRRPGRRVRYLADWQYATKTVYTPQTVVSAGSGGQTQTSTTMAATTVTDTSRKIVRLTASRQRDGEWTVREQAFHADQHQQIDAALAEMHAEADRLDLAERERLAQVYAARRANLPG